MASSKDFSGEGSVTGYDDEDIRGDGKKRKFKPLSAMKKFFTKKKDKKDSVVAVKARSTTALSSDGDEDDDDGGFKSHSKRSALAGNRSLSEDSVFSPEQRGQSIAAFPKAAVSEESLPKSTFQSELMSKLNKRRSEYSDDYHDDGLPRSPVPPVTTTADVIMGGLLKKQPGQSGKKSNIRDSDQSLISVDSSENEEEELFRSKWKSSLPAKKSGATSSTTTDNTMDTLDLNSIQKTDLLVNRAAKDKIMVKPKRKATRQSNKKRDTSVTPPPLPSLNEEPPAKSKPEDVKGSWTSGSPTAKSPERVTFSDEKPSSSSFVASQMPFSADDKPVKPKLSSITISSSGNNAGSPLTSPSSLSPPIVASTAALAAAAPPAKVTTPASPSTGFPALKADLSSSSALSQPASSPSTYATEHTAEIAVGPSIHEKKIENWSISDRGDKSMADVSVTRLTQSTRELNENKPDIDIKPKTSQLPMPALASSKFDPTNISTTDNSPQKVAEPDSDLMTSTKEDYKLRRQVRSRTLSAVIDEKSPPKVQRPSSHHARNSGADFPELQEQPTHLSNEKAPSSLTSLHLTSSSSLDAKKLDNVKFSSSDSTLTSAGEPSWMNMVRKRKDEQEIKFESEKTKATETAVLKSGANVSAPKSVFTSAHYLEKKRGSVETVSYKNRELPDQSLKKIDSSDAKSHNVDLNSQNKHPSVDVSSTKKENFEIEVSQQGSVRASRSIFDSSSKTTSQKDSVLQTSTVPVTVERVRQFSGSLPPVSVSSSSSVKPASHIAQDLGGTTSSTDNVKSAVTSSGITHVRGGSVKTSTTKTTEVKSTFYTRSGSIKGASSVSTSAGSSLASEPTPSVPSKAETTSAFKPDNFEASSAPPSTTLPQTSAPQASMHVAAQPNSSLPPQTSSVTPVSFHVKPFSAYSSKPLSNLASGSRPTYAHVQTDTKLATTTANATTAVSLASSANGVTSALGTTGLKGVSFPNVNPLASSSVAADFSTPVSSAMPIVSTSVTSSNTAIPSSLSSSAFSSSSWSSSVKPHSSVTSSSAFKPPISHTSPSNSTSTPSINKSPSFKAVATSKEKMAASEKVASTATVASTAKIASKEKVTSSEKTTTEGNKAVTSAKVPSWRTHLTSKEVKIEIIENSPSSAPPSTSQTTSEILKKGHDKDKLHETVKRTESTSGAGATVETEKNTRRTSKVLDMVKNFQNLQAPS